MGVDATPLSSNTKHQTNGFDLLLVTVDQLILIFTTDLQRPPSMETIVMQATTVLAQIRALILSAEVSMVVVLWVILLSSNSVQNNGAANNITEMDSPKLCELWKQPSSFTIWTRLY